MMMMMIIQRQWYNNNTIKKQQSTDKDPAQMKPGGDGIIATSVLGEIIIADWTIVDDGPWMMDNDARWWYKNTTMITMWRRWRWCHDNNDMTTMLQRRHDKDTIIN